MKHSLPLFAVLALLVAVSSGCSSIYYKTWEKLGWEKRDILVDRVKDARDDQEAAKKQFQTTLDQFKAVTNFNGGDLEAKYKKLSSSYDDCASRAQAVSDRIKSVEKVANDMFAEWQDELKQYNNQQLRSASEKELSDTKARYQQLIGIMKQAESKMSPVLGAFHDQVLFLKHNLNAQAIASLQTTAASIQSDVEKLIADMNNSINEANAFINDMNKKPAAAAAAASS
jgi:hypothetical protein